MPETASHKIPINLNLLKPQSETPKRFVEFFHWVLFAGRYIIILVEIVVLVAFFARFKLDADIDATQTKIDEQTAFIQGLKSTEIEARQVQFQISNIKSLKAETPDLAIILQHIADQTPTDITLSNLTAETNSGKTTIKINGDAKDNNQVNALTNALSQDPFFSEVSLSNIGLEQGVIKFAVTAATRSQVAAAATTPQSAPGTTTTPSTGGTP